MTLQERHEIGNLIEVYKIGEVRQGMNGTRLVKELETKGMKQRQNFFSDRVVQKRNNLPIEDSAFTGQLQKTTRQPNSDRRIDAVGAIRVSILD